MFLDGLASHCFHLSKSARTNIVYFDGLIEFRVNADIHSIPKHMS